MVQIAIVRERVAKFRRTMTRLNFALHRPMPPMQGFLKQHMSPWDKIRERFYTFFAFKFFGTTLSHWGVRGLGRVHGKYNWPPFPPQEIKK